MAVHSGIILLLIIAPIASGRTENFQDHPSHVKKCKLKVIAQRLFLALWNVKLICFQCVWQLGHTICVRICNVNVGYVPILFLSEFDLVLIQPFYRLNLMVLSTTFSSRPTLSWYRDICWKGSFSQMQKNVDPDQPLHLKRRVQISGDLHCACGTLSGNK